MPTKQTYLKKLGGIEFLGPLTSIFILKSKVVEVTKYIDSFPEDVALKLNELRELILKIIPVDAIECISYGMPAYKWNGILVYFAGYKKHIGFYPTPEAIIAFKNKLTSYPFSKGAIQFPLDKDLPVDLITEIVLHRINQNKK